MKCKKVITVIIATLLILLPMMTTTVQAVGRVYNLTAQTYGRGINFKWQQVSGADGYNLYINTANKGYELIGSVSGTKATVVGFEANKTYKAKVCAYELKWNGQKVEGSASTEITINYEEKLPTIVLPKVTGLNVKQSGEFINLTWNEVSNATGYLVYANMPGFGYMNLGKVFSNNIFIKGGIAGKAYEFKVCAYKDTNSGIVYGTHSDTKSITIDDKEDEIIKLSRPIGLYVTNVTKSTAYVEWNKVTNATGYEIWIARGNGSFTHIANTTKTYADMSGLESNTTYRIIIVAYNDTKYNTVYSQDSSIYSFTTARNYEEEKPEQVKYLEVKVNNNSATLSWDKVAGARGYNIYLAEGNGNFKYVKYSTGLTATLTGLDYNKTYRVKVCAYKNINGKEVEGEFSSTRIFTIENYKVENIKGFKAEVKHRNEAYLSWWAIDNADGYEVWAAEDGATFERVGNATDSTYILYNLEYKTDYKVKVRAYKYKNGSRNYGNFSTVKYFTTERYDKYEDSQNVGNINYVNYYVIGDTVYLNWSKVSKADGYEIEFTVPGIGGTVKLLSSTNNREISGLTDKEHKYTARVRAYRIINGAYEYGQYSEIKKFAGK